MQFKLQISTMFLVFLSVILMLEMGKSWAQDEPMNRESINIPLSLVEKLFNSSDHQSSSSVWLLVPSGVNLSDMQQHDASSPTDFSLFKLDNGALINTQTSDSTSADDNLEREPRSLGTESSSSLSSSNEHRQARKFHFFKNVLNKPKISPLYLVNGTVCRFVNSQPICTTLSTTGLLRGQIPINQQPNGFFNGNQQQQQSNGFFNGNQQQGNPNNFNNNNPNNFNNNNNPNNFNNNQNQNNLNNLNNNNNLQPNQRQLNVLPNQGFNPNQNVQPFRQAAMMDDEPSELMVESSSSSSSSSSSPANATSSDLDSKASNNINTSNNNNHVVAKTRPVNVLVSRRPLNFMAFARPFGTQYQFGSRRMMQVSSRLIPKQLHQQGKTSL